MIYLASPYSHPDPAVRQERYLAACRGAARLIRQGHVVFSPIVHSHPLAELGLPRDWTYWRRHDREHLERAGEVVVLMLEGWRESTGVQAEIRMAREMGKPLWFMGCPDAIVRPTVAPVAEEA